MCRRELDKAESEIKKNSSIIGDYKQVSFVPGAGLGTLWVECALCFQAPALSLVSQ